MYNGFIYQSLDWLIHKLNYLNLFELFKAVARWLNKDKTDIAKKVKYARVSADIYITFKWVFVLIVWNFDIKNYLVSGFIWYLIIANVYTFFYYFIWKEDNPANFDSHRIKRRFIHLLQAILFSQVAFAALYFCKYHYDFSWESPATRLNSFWLSVSNSVAGSFNPVKPITQVAYTVSRVQSLITFVYLSVIISRAVPNNNK